MVRFKVHKISPAILIEKYINKKSHLLINKARSLINIIMFLINNQAMIFNSILIMHKL
jgi:hypothetical protein